MSAAIATKTRILIVEDEALVAEDLRMRLERMGYEVVGIVDRAQQVLPTTLATSPALVLMDIKLKGEGDGISAGQRLRSLHQVPFVFVTSHADRATLDRACGAEPFGYVVKPFDERAIQAAIEMALTRHRAEQQLRSMEARLSTILRNIGDAVIVTDIDERITFMNHQGENISQWPAASALGEPFDRVFQLVRGADGAAVPSPVSAAMRCGQTVRLEDDAELVTRDGVRVPVDDTANPIREANDAISGAVVVLRDCTERVALAREKRKADQQMQEARRLESLGRVAGGLAHDFNNMLTAIMGNAELLAHELSGEDSRLELLRAIESSARAAAGICDRLRDSAALGIHVREPVNLRGVITETLDLVRVLLGSDTRLELELTSPLPTPLGDRIQLQQVVMNLLVNAAEAIGPAAGTITVRTGVMQWPMHQSAPQGPRGDAVTVPSALADGAYVFVEVEDDGEGMTTDVMGRIFDPFFSTKKTGRGLGLSGVLGIVRSHCGGIRVQSAPGHGSAFRVLLPLDGSVGRAEADPGVPVAPGAASTRVEARSILVVDDDPAVRRLVCRLVSRQGLPAVEAETGEHAVRLLAEQAATFAAAVVDVNMPGMSGLELVAVIAERWPAVRTMLISGTMPTATARTHGVAVLAKPFKASEFAARLADLVPHLIGD